MTHDLCRVWTVDPHKRNEGPLQLELEEKRRVHQTWVSLLDAPSPHLIFTERKMQEFSAVDGFVELSESVGEMIKYAVNEPSVGLFFIQHHAHNAVPNVIELKKNLVEKSHETTLHTEDLDDSITMVRSMTECGYPIADGMIKEIKKSLATMATKQPKRGPIHPSASSSATEGASFWGNTKFYAQEGNEKRSNYFSSVFKTAKQKAGSFKWPQLDDRGSINSKGETPERNPNFPSLVTSASTASSSQGADTDELPLSSQVDESQHEQINISDISKNLLSVAEKYDDFKAHKEAKLEEWLEGTSNLDDNGGTGDEERC